MLAVTNTTFFKHKFYIFHVALVECMVEVCRLKHGYFDG